MYEYLKGIITKITAKYIVLEANGIGYILHVANPYAYSGQVNQEIPSRASHYDVLQAFHQG